MSPTRGDDLPRENCSKRTGCRALGSAGGRTWNLLIPKSGALPISLSGNMAGEVGIEPTHLTIQNRAPYLLGYSPGKLVDLARLERATSTFAEWRSHSAELQVQRQG